MLSADSEILPVVFVDVNDSTILKTCSIELNDQEDSNEARNFPSILVDTWLLLTLR